MWRTNCAHHKESCYTKVLFKVICLDSGMNCDPRSLVTHCEATSKVSTYITHKGLETRPPTELSQAFKPTLQSNSDRLLVSKIPQYSHKLHTVYQKCTMNMQNWKLHANIWSLQTMRGRTECKNSQISSPLLVYQLHHIPYQKAKNVLFVHLWPPPQRKWYSSKKKKKLHLYSFTCILLKSCYIYGST